MNLLQTLEILAGGEGSGCHGPNCGRPKGSGSDITDVASTAEWDSVANAKLEDHMTGSGASNIYLTEERVAAKKEIVKRLASTFPDPRVAESDINASLKVWASSSGDHHAYAVAVQLAAEKEFNLSTGEQFPLPHLRDESPQSKATREEAAQKLKEEEIYDRTMLRAMYNYTQKELEDAGIDKVSVARGMSWRLGEEPEWVRALRKAPNNEMEVEIDSQPMSSWSASKNVAIDFAFPMDEEHTSVVVTTTVPRERVLSTARTGFGALPEEEVVILKGHGTAKATLLRISQPPNL